MADILRGQPFSVTGLHDGLNTIGYRLLLNGTVAQERPASELQGGVIAFPFPAGLPKNTYLVSAVAYNDDGVSAPANLSLVITGTVPAPITSLTVI